MSKDLRLSRMLHVLIHMAEYEGAATSQAIAVTLNTNPVVVRRTMAGLRQRGLVLSEKGHHGGWRLTRPLDRITLRDIHEALGPGSVFALGPARDHPACLVEQAVNASLAIAFARAEAVLLQELGSRTLAEVRQDFEDLRAGRSPHDAHPS
ncbi:Rrf2 family transcriptional regulator [Rubellimicrobium rubrum]|uniref:Rrf2 family transcriptional regulator n=1 Tax=Rubellimicrobium rubrum TaxID=2585369 RepID=A0A5C4MLM6_9RHOB|nr:Rrf2 family transcriptional regulator [Rubellimicrobium rubrum]TNC46219.1 Rrf2 family transcriptional regulator [Rubellimicrobium rubrum]